MSAPLADAEPGLVYTEPGAWHPAASPLGRLVRGRADRRQAETRAWAAALATAVALLLALQTAWALAGAERPALLLAASAGAWIAWAALALAGRRPGVCVALGPERVTVRQGRRALRVPRADVRDVRRVSAQAAHEHWKRYARTQVFQARHHPEALVLRLPGGTPVLIAMPSDALAGLEQALCAQAPARRAKAPSERVEELA